MGLFGNSKQLSAKIDSLTLEVETAKLEIETVRSQRQPSALLMNFGGYSMMYDGEKTPNELGTPYEHELDYYRIRMRAWEAMIKSTVIQTAVKQYVLWIVGSGLKFQATPSEDFLEQIGIKIDKKLFSKNVEARFRLFTNDKRSTYTKEMNLHELIAEALKNAILSGDVLFIVRYEGYQPTVEIIDGCFISTPPIFNSAAVGNKIINGVEISPRGIHVAYHIQQADGTFQRILANPSGKIGSRQAWLMVGQRHKINDTRGMSLLTAVMERDAKLDRFLEASVGSAEENSKMPYQIVHTQYSEGEDPLINQTAQAAGIQKTTINETATLEGYASKITQTTGKETYNMPVGAEFKPNITHSDPNFASFYTPNAELIYSTIGIPPEVALGKYGGTYSGSRAAQKSWEYKMRVERVKTISEFGYKPIYEFWFLINFYKLNIIAPGFSDAIKKDDWQVRSAYTNCRFVGQSVPHIDPVKEANANRIMLGTAYDNIPIITGEQVCEQLNTGDFDEVQKTAQKEVEDNYFHDEIESSLMVDSNSKDDKNKK